MPTLAVAHQECMAVQFGESQIQQNQVIGAGFREIKSLRPVHGKVYRITRAFTKRPGDILRQTAFVLHEQHPHNPALPCMPTSLTMQATQ